MENVYKRTGILFKILPCIFLVIFIGMICCSGCFASFVVTYEDINISIPDLPFSLEDTTQNVFLYVTYRTDAYSESSPYYGTPYYQTLYLITTDASDFYYNNFNCTLYTYSKGFNGKLSNSLDSGEWSSGVTGSYSALKNRTNMSLIFSTCDVLDKDGSVVFQATPQVEGIIAKQIQPEEMNKTLQEIVGILPIVMIVVVSYLALRKALKMLSSSLKQS